MAKGHTEYQGDHVKTLLELDSLSDWICHSPKNTCQVWKSSLFYRSGLLGSLIWDVTKGLVKSLWV